MFFPTFFVKLMISSLLFEFSPYFLARLTIVSSNLHCFGSKLSNRQRHLQLTEGVQSHRTQPGSLDPYIDPDIHELLLANRSNLFANALMQALIYGILYLSSMAYRTSLNSIMSSIENRTPSISDVQLLWKWP